MSTGLASKFNIVAASEPEAAEYKPSQYNHFVEKGDKVWGVNFLSRAFVRLGPDTYRKVRRVLDGEQGGDLGTVRRDLIKGRFLIPVDFDEMNYLKTRHHASRFGRKGLTLIVAPTLRCNFGCEYCYVDLNANRMKPEDRVKVGKFFDRKLPDGTRARIVWTGGDPSLAMDVVEDLSHRFIASAARKGSPYQASLITNAYLLNDKMRERLRSSRIDKLQISLDGSKEFHDASRYLANGRPTYDRIMENVEATCDDFDIYLRINVDAKNHPRIPDLMDDLEQRGLKSRLRIYFAHVDDVNENSAGYHDSCLQVAEYARVEASLIRLAVEQGFKVGGRVLTQPVKTFCGANSLNYYVIDSKANLLKCYHDFGTADKNGIGHIGEEGEEVVTNQYNLWKWLGWSPFELDDCRTCKVLPLCMGGCSHKIMNNGMDVARGCLKLRFTTDEIVDLYGELKTMDSGCSGCAGAAAV